MSLREGRFRLGSGDIIQQLGPLLYWKCNELSGTTIKDSSGNGNDGTASGTFTLNFPGGLANNLSAIKGDGATGVITGPAIDLTPTSTILFFARIDVTPGANIRVAGCYGANVIKLQFQPTDTSYVFFLGLQGVSGQPLSGFNAANGFYYFGAGRGDGVNINAYLNSKKSIAQPSATDPDASAFLALAGQGNFFAGAMCSIAAFNKTLTDTQLLYIYQMMRSRIFGA